MKLLFFLFSLINVKNDICRLIISILYLIEKIKKYENIWLKQCVFIVIFIYKKLFFP